MVDTTQVQGEGETLVNVGLIARAVKDSPALLGIVKRIACHKRGRHTLSAARLRRDVHDKTRARVSQEDVHGFLTVLHEAGAGIYAQNADFKKSQIFWRVSSYDLMKAVLAVHSGKSKSDDTQPIASPTRRPSASKHAQRSLPRLAAPVSPVSMAQGTQKSADASPRPSQSVIAAAEGESTILVQFRGMEFELDLTQVPAELLKLRRVL